MPSYPIPTQSNPQEFREQGDERLINCFAEMIGTDQRGKPKYRVRVTPGFLVFSDNVNDVNHRGSIEADGNVYVVFEGGNVVKINSTGGRTTIGYIGGNGPVDMARNGRVPFQIGCVSVETGKYYVIESDVVSLVDTRQFEGFNSITWLAGYFLLGVGGTQRFYNTGYNDAKSIANVSNFSGLDFAVAEGNPDGLVRVFAFNLELVIMGEKSLETWYLDPNPPATGSPFVRAGAAVVPRGCASALSCVLIDNSFMWLGNDGKVYRNDNNTPIRISHYGVERSIAAQQNKTTIRASRWTYKGNEFYQISGDDFTWTFNAATRFWHEGKSYLRNRLNADAYVEAWGETYCFTKINGTMYLLDDKVVQEGVDPLVATIRFADSPRNVEFNFFEAMFITGRAPINGTSNQTEPRGELLWSDDGGAPWKNRRIRQAVPHFTPWPGRQ
jgi:hypothetical protein